MSYDISGVSGAPDKVNRNEGIYFVQVDGAEGRTSQNGNAMISMKLISVDDYKFVVYDRIMLQGKEGALSMTKAKLKALGFDLSKGTLEPEQLIGLRAYVAIHLGKPNDKGEQYMEVNIRAKGSKCGYWSEDEPPPSRQGNATDGFAAMPNEGETPW